MPRIRHQFYVDSQFSQDLKDEWKQEKERTGYDIKFSNFIVKLLREALTRRKNKPPSSSQ